MCWWCMSQTGAVHGAPPTPPRPPTPFLQLISGSFARQPCLNLMHEEEEQLTLLFAARSGPSAPSLPTAPPIHLHPPAVHAVTDPLALLFVYPCAQTITLCYVALPALKLISVYTSPIIAELVASGYWRPRGERWAVIFTPRYFLSSVKSHYLLRKLNRRKKKHSKSVNKKRDNCQRLLKSGERGHLSRCHNRASKSINQKSYTSKQLCQTLFPQRQGLWEPSKRHLIFK